MLEFPFFSMTFSHMVNGQIYHNKEYIEYIEVNVIITILTKMTKINTLI